MAEVTFTIDGREVSVPEGLTLVDAAKHGDVEIPVFCYDRKLGGPVGACRMCLVEIEGMPKLQTGCSTVVRDGMVVRTRSEQARAGQESVVEFILANHPLDCPVCDKGGECPLQDVTMGWGKERSRFTDVKRHWPKPAALSPLIAIDRERCILCYRCVRFSQEVSEDYQLALMGRGAHTHVATFDGHPYLGPFSGNIVELCPVGALTSIPYRFKARPWDLEDSASVCTLCPSQCNITYSIRDERVTRVLWRDNEEVDDGWTCDRGRFAYQMFDSPERIGAPLIRTDGNLVPTTWKHALDRVAGGLERGGLYSAALVGGPTTNEEGFLLQRIFREALGSPHVDSRIDGVLEPEVARLLAHPDLTAKTADIDGASAILVFGADPINQSSIVDLRIRKAVRRGGAKLLLVANRPTELDGVATHRLAFGPGGEEALLLALIKALDDLREGGHAGLARAQFGSLAGAGPVTNFLSKKDADELSQAADAEPGGVREMASALADARRIVIVWPERLGHGGRGKEALRALANLALYLGIQDRAGAGLYELPEGTNGRGLREVGCLPNLGPGLSDPPTIGMSASEMRRTAAHDDLRAIYLMHVDPVAECPQGDSWRAALERTDFVVAQAEFLTDAIDRYADVVLPAECNAEKEGTVTHPDGRLQRVRPAIGHPMNVRMEWQVLADLAKRLGIADVWRSQPQVFRSMVEEVPFYDGLALGDIGAKGVRWQERHEAAAATRSLGPIRAFKPDPPAPAPRPDFPKARLSTHRTLWSGDETRRAPALRFMRPHAAVEIATDCAAALGVRSGDSVEVAVNGHRLVARASVREMVHPGSVHLVEGVDDAPANLLSGADEVELKKAKPRKAGGKP